VCGPGPTIETKMGGFACGNDQAQSRVENMFRITVVENALEERWVLQGQLTKRSVTELISSWRASKARPSTRSRIVDLNEVTSIDKSGEEALAMMAEDGATFVASGVYTRHLVEQLGARQAKQQHRD
jgi:hypothetical protein